MIKLIVTDCDGVLTPDYKWYNEAGELTKRFSTKDMTIARVLEKLGVRIIVLSGDDRVNKKFCDMHRIEFFYSVHNKAKVLKGIAHVNCLPLRKIMFIGDDLMDLEAGVLSGVFVCPSDAAQAIKLNADETADVKGGEGVLVWVYENLRHLFPEEK
jgi:YrbI family 3-deoxy-D-manno-octulosonate 8-phosphate phosphatase